MRSNTLTVNKKGSLMYITFPQLIGCGVVRHTFSTRLGGVSKGKFSQMNLSFNRGDKREAVERNYEILCGAVGIDVSH
ncbi:MAG: laccase domain-containing protein, partial [Clostridia bacterium]|nr:laccase domain-containing protein [Clostridia bacterium]